MVEIQVSYEGNLRTTAVHEPSSATFITDAPKDNQGEGKSFSPTDLVATALGTCMLTTMGIVARNFKIDLSGATARVHKEMITSPMRRVGKLTVEVTVPKPTTPEQQQKLEHAALHCPVFLSLNPEIEIPVKFNFGV